MTYDPDIDPKTWKAEKQAYENALKQITEERDHAVKEWKKFLKLYLDLYAKVNGGPVDDKTKN